jgi:hypothetical protein
MEIKDLFFKDNYALLIPDILSAVDEFKTKLPVMFWTELLSEMDEAGFSLTDDSKMKGSNV